MTPTFCHSERSEKTQREEIVDVAFAPSLLRSAGFALAMTKKKGSNDGGGEQEGAIPAPEEGGLESKYYGELSGKTRYPGRKG